tara:strand:+ start:120 stop:332 length:213 start_codon:yes stop_codon:yes gene_type:complete
MDVGDLVRCWAIDTYNKIGLLLEHNKILKEVKVFFQDTGKIKRLYSRDVELFKRSPANAEKWRKKVLDKS